VKGYLLATSKALLIGKKNGTFMEKRKMFSTEGEKGLYFKTDTNNKKGKQTTRKKD
jgi:hypothetical protein